MGLAPLARQCCGREHNNEMRSPRTRKQTHTPNAERESSRASEADTAAAHPRIEPPGAEVKFRRRCGRGVGPTPAQMWKGRAQSRSRCRCRSSEALRSATVKGGYGAAHGSGVPRSRLSLTHAADWRAQVVPPPRTCLTASVYAVAWPFRCAMTVVLSLHAKSRRRCGGDEPTQSRRRCGRAQSCCRCGSRSSIPAQTWRGGAQCRSGCGGQPRQAEARHRCGRG